MADKEEKPEQLKRSVIYESPWVNLFVDRVKYPSGLVLEQHHVLDFEREAVAAVVENDLQDVLLVQVYRYVTDSLEWEIPAGGIKKGEAILDAAKREIWEESGYETIDHELIYSYYPMNGIANKVFHLVKARALNKTADFDRNEIKAIRWVSRDEIKAMIRGKLIKDGFSLTGLLLQ